MSGPKDRPRVPVLTTDDIAAILRKDRRSAQRAIRAGLCGRFKKIGNRYYVLEDEFLKAMKGEQ